MATAVAPAIPIMDQELVEVPIAKLLPAEDNLRRQLGDLDELTQSIRALGLIEPLVATPAAGGRYQLIAGHRRLAAAQQAGLHIVPVYVRVLDEPDRVAAMLVENLQRNDLQPLEEAAAYRRLLDEFGMRQGELAEKIGRSQGHISKRLTLLKLPDRARAELDAGGITLDDARALSQLVNMPARLETALKEGKRWGDVGRAVSSQLRDHELEQKIAKTRAELEAAGVKLVKAPENSWSRIPGGGIRLDSYEASKLKLKAAAHAKLPCHGAFIHDYNGEPVYICTNPKSHTAGDAATRTSDDEKAKARAEREKERRAQLRAREKNIELGRALATKLAAPKIDAASMRLLADMLMIEIGSELAQTSFRFVDEASQTLVTRRDGTVSRISHIDGLAARKLLDDRLADAKTAEQIMGVLLQAMLAAKLHDKRAVPRSQQIGHVKGIHSTWGPGPSKPIRQALDSIAKQHGIGILESRPKSAAA